MSLDLQLDAQHSKYTDGNIWCRLVYKLSDAWMRKSMTGILTIGLNSSIDLCIAKQERVRPFK